MELHTLWFILVAILWIGYFTLEGFDFGVGMLLPILAKDETERRVMYNSIGPTWDANEVWVLTAGGAIFASFPFWYATLFSGFFLPLLLILVALIVRNLAFEYRAKRDDATWRRNWDYAAIFGSYLPALLWGVAFANIVAGVPLARIKGQTAEAYVDYTGNLFTLLNPFGLLGGLVTMTLFMTHGAMFLALKTEGDIRLRARAFAIRSGVVAAVLAVVFLVWTMAKDGWTVMPVVLFTLAAVALLVSLWMARGAREGWAFILTFATIALAVAGLFWALFPNVLPDSSGNGVSLTVSNASATGPTLTVMTVVALVFTPIVLVYTSWTYWVFRKRIGTRHIPTAELASTH